MMTLRKIVLLFLTFLVIPALFAQQRHALVIGNSNYTGISSLRNPVNDANDMTAALRGLGFTVETVLDGSLDQMENAASNFVRRLGSSRNTYGFFFYAGHGVQSSGENYLIPIDATNIHSENHLRQRAFSVQTLLDNMNDAGNELNIIVLDACRDNPFGWSRSGSRGLSVIGRAPAGSIIMFATSANSVASDGTGRNGLFTAQLLNNLRTPGLSVRDIFDRTGEDVLRVSEGRQHPELSVRFFGASSTFLGPRPAAPAATPLAQTTPAAIAPTPAPVTADGFLFERGAITGYTGSETNIVIPFTINEERVNRIGDRAFASKQLTSVTIPSSITSIEASAFENNQLTSVAIPSSVTTIGSNAFASNQLTSVTIPSGVTSIENWAFANNQLTSVTIPYGVTSIRFWAFANNQLTRIDIGANVSMQVNSFDSGFPAFYNNRRRAGVYTFSNNRWRYSRN